MQPVAVATTAKANNEREERRLRRERYVIVGTIYARISLQVKERRVWADAAHRPRSGRHDSPGRAVHARHRMARVAVARRHGADHRAHLRAVHDLHGEGGHDLVFAEKFPAAFTASVVTVPFLSVTTTDVAPFTPLQSFGSWAVGYTVPATA